MTDEMKEVRKRWLEKCKNAPVPRANIGRDRVLSCLWKRGYLEPKDARLAARRTPHLPGHDIVAYKCRHCDLWHVGNRLLPDVEANHEQEIGRGRYGSHQRTTA